MKRVLYIILLMACSSCMRNFDPATDSDMGSIVLDVDVMPMLAPITDWETGMPFFSDPRIPDVYSSYTKLRITAYCYRRDNGVLAGQAIVFVSDFSSPARLEVRHLEKAEEYDVVVMAEFVYIDGYGSVNETWYHAFTGSYEQFRVQRERGPANISDVIGGISVCASPSDSPLAVALPGLGKFCQLHFVNCGLVSHIYFKYSQKLVFSPFLEEGAAEGSMFDYIYPSENTTDYWYGIYYVPDGSTTLRLSYGLYRSGSEGGEDYEASADVEGMSGCEFEIDCSDGKFRMAGKW